MHRILYICLALALLTVGVFWPVRNHEFVNYDDPDYVTANPIVQNGLTRDGVVWAFQNIHAEKTYWHPLTWLTHMADCQFFGMNPRGHHLGNVILHTLNVVLLFLILVQSTGAPWRSAIVAALFAIHPLQMDTVAWVTERKNVLSAFFMLLSLLAYVRYAKFRGPILYSLVIVFFAAALMSKPAVVTFPCLLLLLDVWPLRRVELARFSNAGPAGETMAMPPLPKISPRLALLEKVPLFLLSAASCKLTLMAHEGLGMLGAEYRWPLGLRLENAIVSYARYLKKFLWPDDLAVLYPHPGKWPFWEVVLSGVVLLAISALAVRTAKSRPYLSIGWFWFLGMLVPAIGIVQVGFQSMADRFVYLPLIGVLVAVVWSFADLARVSPARRRLLAIGAGVAVAIYGSATVLQLKHWQNSITLWEHTLRVTRNNYMAHHDLGVALREKNKLTEARAHLESTLSLKENPATRFELARVFELEHATNDAIAQLEKAILLAPRWPDPRERLGYLLAQSSQQEAALTQYSELLRMAPGRADLHVAVAALLSGIHRVGEAVGHYREALRLNPNDVVALNNLAWLLATNPDDKVRNGYEATSYGERACALTQWRNPGFLATLAAAHAERGNFQQAVELITRAHAIATAAQESRVAQDCEKLRTLFLSQTPFRDVDKR
jgi:tetratricopeptide (TPR) repeat protein